MVKLSDIKSSIFGMILFCMANFTVFAVPITKNLFINEGFVGNANQSKTPVWAFNESKVFEPKNVQFIINIGDTLHLIVENNTTKKKSFCIQKGILIHKIEPSQSYDTTIVFNQSQVVLFYEPDGYKGLAMGLAGMIYVKPKHIPIHQIKLWNIKEYHHQTRVDILRNIPFDLINYNPDYFTTNALVYPDIQNDISSRIRLKLRDTLYIVIANTGIAKHVIHCQGYAFNIVWSKAHQLTKHGRKDTFPFASLESAVLMMVADKRGFYSFHNANLSAAMGNANKPNGMFHIMQIDE